MWLLRTALYRLFGAAWPHLSAGGPASTEVTVVLAVTGSTPAVMATMAGLSSGMGQHLSH